jgi:hypothetical protein
MQICGFSVVKVWLETTANRASKNMPTFRTLFLADGRETEYGDHLCSAQQTMRLSVASVEMRLTV